MAGESNTDTANKDEGTNTDDNDTSQVDDDNDDGTFDETKAKAKIKKANDEARNLRKRLKELEPLADKAKADADAKKTETERLSEERDRLKTEHESSQRELVRLRVALRKGLTETQAKRLIGDTEEDLEADADELLDSFGDKKLPSDQPKEKLRPGSSTKYDDERNSFDAEEVVKKIRSSRF